MQQKLLLLAIVALIAISCSGERIDAPKTSRCTTTEGTSASRSQTREGQLGYIGQRLLEKLESHGSDCEDMGQSFITNSCRNWLMIQASVWSAMAATRSSTIEANRSPATVRTPN